MPHPFRSSRLGCGLVGLAYIVSLGIFITPAAQASGEGFRDVGTWAGNMQAAILFWLLGAVLLSVFLLATRSRVLSRALFAAALLCSLMPVLITLVCLRHFRNTLAPYDVDGLSVTPGIGSWSALLASAIAVAGIGLTVANRPHTRDHD